MNGPAPGPRSGPAAGRAQAVVGLSGRTLRYAEVARGADGRPRLRRLGAADFEFDAERAVFGTDEADGLASVAEAVAEVFEGAEVDALVVAAHPTVTTAFFTPLPAGMPEEARALHLHQEAALLADVAPTQAVRVHAAPVRTEQGGREWYQVVHVGGPVHVRLSRLADALGAPAYDVVDATHAAARAALAADPEGAALAVGAYPTHTEVAFCRGGAFVFGHHGLGTTPADAVYFVLDALRQVGADAIEVDRLAVYGDAADGDRLALMAEFLGREPGPLDPFAAFARRPDGDPAELASFASVVGAAL